MNEKELADKIEEYADDLDAIRFDCEKLYEKLCDLLIELKH